MTMTAPTNITADWFDLLYGDVPDDEWLTLFTIDRSTGERATRWAPVAQRHQLAAQALELGGHCVWFGVATRADRLANGARGGADECVTVPGMWADIDIAGDAHKGSHEYAPDLASALDLLADYPLPPTAVIHSGHGLQAWWLFNEPQQADDVADLLEQWAITWIELGARRGWKVDNVFDTARVMRLPGTLNNKLHPVPVEVLELHPDRRWGVDDLAQYLLEAPERPKPNLRPAVPYIGPERPGDAFNAQNTCGDVLEAAGWTFHHEDKDGRHYTRPGKNVRDGASATVYRDDGHCIVWSDATSLEVRRSYDPAGLFAHLFHGGDFRAAASALRSQGYGAQPVDLRAFIAAQYAVPASGEKAERPTPPPSFPVDALPAFARAHVLDLARNQQSPVDLPAQIALGALSTICNRNRCTLAVTPSWTEGANLYIAIAMHPGAGKSPVLNRLLAPVVELEERSGRDVAMTNALRAARRISLQAAVDKLEKDMKSGTSSGPGVEKDYAKALVELGEHDADTDMGRLLADDVTPEALIRLLAQNRGRMAIISTEGGIFDNLGRYAEKGKAPNLDGLLKIWSGDTIQVDRAGGTQIRINDPRAVVCITVQPATVAKILADNEFQGRGLVARFMLSLPESLVGRRDMHASGALDPEALEAWRQGVAVTYERGTQAMRMTSDAMKAFNDYRQGLEERRFIGGDLEGTWLTEMSTKCESSVARVSLILAVSEGADEVSDEHVRRAVEIGDYWLGQAVAMAGDAARDLLTTAAERVVMWAETKGHDRVSVRDVQRGGAVRRLGLGADRMAEVFDRAAELGLGAVDNSGRSPVLVLRDSARHARQNVTESEGDSAATTEGDEMSRSRARPKEAKRDNNPLVTPPIPVSPRKVRDMRDKPDLEECRPVDNFQAPPAPRFDPRKLL